MAELLPLGGRDLDGRGRRRVGVLVELVGLLFRPRQALGNQFDDDQNKYRLGRAYTMDLQIGRNLSRNVELFAAAENILNQRYNVANTPFNGMSILNLGPPILYRIGMRLTFPPEGR